MDTFTKEQRSKCMSRIRAKNTTPELKVRTALHKAGYRFRLYDTSMPGRPDLVLQRHKTVVFVNGCFWHHHKGCKKAYWPKSNRTYWIQKIKRNVLHGKRVVKQLEKEGWRVIMIWDCQTRNPEEIVKVFRKQFNKDTQR